MAKHYRHRVVAWWTSGRTGIAKSDNAPKAIHFAAPTQFRGLEGRWTPEDLLLCSLASCFTTTFHTLASYVDFEYTDLEVEAEGSISKIESGYSFKQIVVRPTVTLANEEQRTQALELLEKSKALCLVTRAISTPIKFECSVAVTKPVAAVGSAAASSERS
jgi:organic hydroperoxide reductase OsmC/OhrA